MPPDSAAMRLAAVVAQLGEADQLVGAALRPRGADAEVAGVDDQVLLDAQIGVEAVLLLHDAEPRLDGAAPSRAPSAGRARAPRPRSAPRSR